MKVTIEFYDRPKYEAGAQVIAEKKYEIESFQVKAISDEEIYAEGFDEVDPYGEYLICTFADGEVSTFRNSYADMFKF